MRNHSYWLLLVLLAGCAGPSSNWRGRDDYQALGHAPGWLLTIDDRLKFVTSSPKTLIEVPRPILEPTAAGSRYVAGGLVLDITPIPCNDVRSGVAFADTVQVVANGYSYRGCGGKRVPTLDARPPQIGARPYPAR